MIGGRSEFVHNHRPGLLQPIVPSNAILGKLMEGRLYLRDGPIGRQALVWIVRHGMLLLQLFEFLPHERFNPCFQCLFGRFQYNVRIQWIFPPTIVVAGGLILSERRIRTGWFRDCLVQGVS